jgi:hypothetical protein
MHWCWYHFILAIILIHFMIFWYGTILPCVWLCIWPICLLADDVYRSKWYCCSFFLVFVIVLCWLIREKFCILLLSFVSDHSPILSLSLSYDITVLEGVLLYVVLPIDWALHCLIPVMICILVILWYLCWWHCVTCGVFCWAGRYRYYVMDPSWRYHYFIDSDIIDDIGDIRHFRWKYSWWWCDFVMMEVFWCILIRDAWWLIL